MYYYILYMCVIFAIIISTNRFSEEIKMKKYRILAANKKHFDSLIKDYRSEGYMLITYGYTLAELEKGDEFVIIEIQ